VYPGSYTRVRLTILSGQTKTQKFNCNDREILSFFWPAEFDGTGVNVLDCSMLGEDDFTECCKIYRNGVPPTAVIHVGFKAAGVVGLELEDAEVVRTSRSLLLEATTIQTADRVIWLQMK
jgi:hypothetical protein